MNRYISCFFAFFAVLFRSQAQQDPLTGWNYWPTPTGVTLQSGVTIAVPALPSGSGGTSITPAVGGPSDQDIIALSSGLGNDPLRIFNFVRNRIDYVQYYGCRKGPLMTLLEGSGNDLDQCSLLAALLQASGSVSEIKFCSGFMDVPCTGNSGKNLTEWLGLSDDPFPGLTYAAAYPGSPSLPGISDDKLKRLQHAAAFFRLRGTPSGAADGNFFCTTSDGSALCVERWWLRIVRNGQTFHLDPSFKRYEPIAGLNLPSALGYDRTGFLNAAGGTTGPAWVQSLSESAIGTYLTARTNALRSWITANSAAARLADLVSGRKVKVEEAASLSTAFPLALPLQYAPYNSIPGSMNSTLRIQAGTLDRTINFADLGGRRLALSFAGTAATFHVDDDVLETTTAGQSDFPVTLTVKHPNITAAATPPPVTYKRNDNYAYAIGYSFSPSGRLFQRRYDKLENYLALGKSDSSREVRCEMLNIMAQSFMFQRELVSRACAAYAGVIPCTQQCIGRVGQEGGYYMDWYLLDTRPYASSGSQVPASRAFMAEMMFGSALEHGVVEQFQPGKSGVSTVGILQRTNAAGDKLYYADSLSVWNSLVKNNLSDYTTARLTGLESDFNTPGTRLFLPADGSKTYSHWVGAGYMRARPDNILMAISGGYQGGYATDLWTLVSAPIMNLFSSSPASIYRAPAMPSAPVFSMSSLSSPSLFGSDPVDMATGAFTLISVDLGIGTEEAPRGLRFACNYTSNLCRRNLQHMGFGWTNSLDIRAEVRTAPEEGLGLGTPAQCAAFLSALAAVYDLFRDDSGVKEIATAALTADWLVDRLLNNAVSVSMGSTKTQFIKQPDGTFEPPGGSTLELTIRDGKYILKQRLGNKIHFNSALSAEKIEDVDGKTLTFSYSYVDHGPINYVKDEYGRKLYFYYNLVGDPPFRILKEVRSFPSPGEAGERSIFFEHDTNFNLIKVTDTEGKSEYYDYVDPAVPLVPTDPHTTDPALHRIVRHRDHDGRVITYNIYDNLGRIQRQYLHGDATKAYQLSYTGYESTETDPAGGVTSYYYDERGRSNGVRDQRGFLTSWSYDGQDRIVSRTTPSGETTLFQYDNRHNQTRIDHPRGGGSTLVQYDAFNRVDLVTDPDGHTTDYVYFPDNDPDNGQQDRPKTVIDACGTTTYEYFPSGAAEGRVSKVTDADGIVTTFTYDARGTIYTVTTGGFTTTYDYSKRGDLKDITDPNGIVTEHLYNARRQVTKITKGQGGTAQAVTDFEYDNAGNLKSEINPEDNGAQRFKTRREWSSTKKLTKALTTDEDGEGANDPASIINYDPRDWQSNTLDPLGRTTNFVSWPNGRVQTTTLPLSRANSQNPDGDDRPVSRSAPGAGPGLTRTTTFSYDVTAPTGGYPKTTTMTPDGLSVTEQYSHSGQLRFYTNRLGRTWEFRYDALGRTTHVITPRDAAASRARVMEYTPGGAPKKVTEPSGETVDFSYHPTNGRLSATTYKAGGITQATVTNALYDNNGNLLTLTESRVGVAGTKTTSRTFDPLNRALTRTDENGQQVGYRYYPSGKLKTLIYPGGTDTGTGRVDYTYYKSGQLYQVKDYLDSSSSPRITTYTWNKDGRLASITRPNGSVREIKYDGAGRPEIIQELTAPLPQGKLIFVHKHGYYPSDELAWRYEMPARRTSGLDPPAMGAMTYNEDNQLATFQIPGQGVLTVTHDADGNMTSGPHPSATGFATYTYDSRNRLTGALGFTFTYDAEDNRIGLSGAGETTSFVVDAGAELSKVLVRTKNGVRTRYVWGLGLQYEVNDAAQTTTYHYDAGGSTIALTNHSGVVIERLGYTPWGSINRRTTLSGTPVDTPFLYTGFFGCQTDSTGLHYLRARYYHPRIARFLNADPARDGWNWYAFANGNPINMGDPSGLGAAAFADAVQSVFSFLGMVPVVGAFFDVANAAISAARGNYVLAGASLAAAIPGIGDIMGGARLGMGAARSLGGSSLAASPSYFPAFIGGTPVWSMPGIANGVGRSNAQLVQQVAIRTEAWGARQGIPAAGSGPVQGTLKHGYAQRLLDRYQSMYGSRGLQTEVSYLNGKAVPYGTRGSVRLDVYEPSTGRVWDYKFTTNPSLSGSRVQRIINNGPAGINTVDAIGP
jgi:RHS repeat-associated protein